jgi:hypothetical protein
VIVLLDANGLIALLVDEHGHHRAWYAMRWRAGSGYGVADERLHVGWRACGFHRALVCSLAVRDLLRSLCTGSPPGPATD